MVSAYMELSYITIYPHARWGGMSVSIVYCFGSGGVGVRILRFNMEKGLFKLCLSQGKGVGVAPIKCKMYYGLAEHQNKNTCYLSLHISNQVYLLADLANNKVGFSKIITLCKRIHIQKKLTVNKNLNVKNKNKLPAVPEL